MCGRYGLALSGEEIADILQLELGLGVSVEPRYNIAPCQLAPVVRLDQQGRRRLHLISWGLIPSWSRDPGVAHKLINARSETAAEKPSFREAMSRRRCLVPADGFYEWRRSGGSKVAHHIGREDGALFCFAGLWERWTSPDGETRDTFSILTTTPNDLVSTLHDRMPVILAPSDHDRWLSREVPAAGVADLLRPASEEAWTAWPVGSDVHHVDREGPDLRTRVDPVEQPRLL